MRYVIFGFALLACAGSVSAQVYKCESGNGNIVYSDSPCKSGMQTITDIPVAMPDNNPDSGASSALTRQMDIAVKSALATDDLQRAQALATTREHWEWIAAARREADSTAVRGRTEADLSAERADSQACRQATRSYELEASSTFDEPETLAARRSIMRAACGIQEPLEVNNYQKPAPVIYPGFGHGYKGPGYGYPRRPGWNHHHIPAKPKPVEPPAVSVIVGPAAK